MNDDNWGQFPPIEGNGVPGDAVVVLVAVVVFLVAVFGAGVAVGAWLF